MLYYHQYTGRQVSYISMVVECSDHRMQVLLVTQCSLGDHTIHIQHLSRHRRTNYQNHLLTPLPSHCNILKPLTLMEQSADAVAASRPKEREVNREQSLVTSEIFDTLTYHL